MVSVNCHLTDACQYWDIHSFFKSAPLGLCILVLVWFLQALFSLSLQKQFVLTSSFITETYRIKQILSLSYFLLVSHKESRSLEGEDGHADGCDHARCADLMIQTLKVDSSEIIQWSQTFQHPFVTMSHVVGTFNMQ